MNKHSLKPPIVQLALDLPTIEEALAVAAMGVRAGVDLLEAGTPLIVAEGARSIGAIAQAFPNFPVLADYKTMDSGFKNVLITQAQGGHYMTVCANSPDETVQSAIAEGKKTGIVVVTDTIGVVDQAGRARQCAEWGVDMVYLHYGADQRRADDSRDTVQWLPEVLAAVDVPVGVATFGVEDAVRAVAMGASLVAIGHPLITGPDAEQKLAEFVRRVKESYRPAVKA
jgi:3-hexulose-6-phosphate synthase/6-phospho-3-hexuloisomerase